MLKELSPGFAMMVVMTVLTGFIYPAVVTGLSQVLFRDQANGSLIVSNGQVVGSRLIGQNFTKPEYFQPRPSAAGSGYDPTASGGINLGPTSAKLMNGATKKDDKGNEVVDFDGIKDRIVHYCIDNGIAYESSVPLERFKDARGDLDDVKLIKAFNDDKAPLVFTPKAPIPADAVTASSSGLDPHISPRNAELQAPAIAKARGIPVEQVLDADGPAHRGTRPRLPGRAPGERPGVESRAGPAGVPEVGLIAQSHGGLSHEAIKYHRVHRSIEDDATFALAARSRGVAPGRRGDRARRAPGQLKIFLGYASRVGKSFRLFDEGRRRHDRGEDVVIAAVQPDAAPEILQIIRGLEVIRLPGYWRHSGDRCPGPSLTSSASLPDRRPGLRQPAGQPARQALRGCRGAARRQASR